MKPPIRGPIEGPTKGAMENINIGACISLAVKRSPTVPPDTARNALPEKPSRNRLTMMVSMF
jgi:hypothetical protein